MIHLDRVSAGYVSGRDILVDGRRIASVADVMGAGGDLIEPLRSELELLASRPALREDNQGQGKAVTIMGDKDYRTREFFDAVF